MSQRKGSGAGGGLLDDTDDAYDPEDNSGPRGGHATSSADAAYAAVNGHGTDDLDATLTDGDDTRYGYGPTKTERFKAWIQNLTGRQMACGAFGIVCFFVVVGLVVHRPHTFVGTLSGHGPVGHSGTTTTGQHPSELEIGASVHHNSEGSTHHEPIHVVHEPNIEASDGPIETDGQYTPDALPGEHMPHHDPNHQGGNGFGGGGGVSDEQFPTNLIHPDDTRHPGEYEHHSETDATTGKTMHSVRIVHPKPWTEADGSVSMHAVPLHSVSDSVAVLMSGGERPMAASPSSGDGPHLHELTEPETQLPHDVPIEHLYKEVFDSAHPIRWFWVMRDIHVWRAWGKWTNGKGAEEKWYHFTSYRPQSYDHVRHGLAIHRHWTPLNEVSLLTVRAHPAPLPEGAHDTPGFLPDSELPERVLLGVGVMKSGTEPDGTHLSGGESQWMMYSPAHWTHEQRALYVQRVLRVVERHELPRRAAADVPALTDANQDDHSYHQSGLHPLPEHHQPDAETQHATSPGTQHLSEEHREAMQEHSEEADRVAHASAHAEAGIAAAHHSAAVDAAVENHNQLDDSHHFAD